MISAGAKSGSGGTRADQGVRPTDALLTEDLQGLAA
jgi:hypothetical protein